MLVMASQISRTAPATAAHRQTRLPNVSSLVTYLTGPTRIASGAHSPLAICQAHLCFPQLGCSASVASSPPTRSRLPFEQVIVLVTGNSRWLDGFAEKLHCGSAILFVHDVALGDFGDGQGQHLAELATSTAQSPLTSLLENNVC